MKRLIGLTLAVLVAASLFATTTVRAQSNVSFERDRQWLVTVNGSVVSWHDTQNDARAVAADHKRETPANHVAYTSELLSVATIALAPSPTATATPVPPTPVPPTATATPVPPTPVPPTPVPPTATATPVRPTPTATVVLPTATPTAVVPVGQLVWGYDASPLDNGWTKPALNDSYTDPAYGTTVTRVTSADGTRFDRNTYSRRQAENADGSMFMTYHGTAAYHVYDRQSGRLVRALPIHPDAEPQWHPTNPSLIRYIEGPNSYVGDLLLFEIDVATGAAGPIADLTEPIRAALPTADYLKDRAEGSPSADGNRYAWLVYDSSEQIVGIVTYDLARDQVLGILPANELPDAGRLDALSMSPTGNYVVTQHGDGTYVYDADLTDERLIFAGGEHSDIALGADGRDVYVYIDFTAGSNGGWLVAVDLETLTSSLIFDLYQQANTSIHISGKGYGKPGWVVASTYNCHAGFAWSCFKVMAVELAPNGRVLNLAHTYNCGASYWTETHAVVNRDFTRVYFNSDGGSCGIDAEVYLIDVPDFN